MNCRTLPLKKPSVMLPKKSTTAYPPAKHTFKIPRILKSQINTLKGLNYVALRYFNASGYDTAGRITGLEKGTTNLIPILMEVVFGMRKKVLIFGDDYDTPDGTCVRDYFHVQDLGQAHLLALQALKNGMLRIQTQ